MRFTIEFRTPARDEHFEVGFVEANDIRTAIEKAREWAVWTDNYAAIVDTKNNNQIIATYDENGNRC